MVYDAFGQIVAEYGGGALRRENVYRGGQLLASQEFTTPAPTPKNVVWTNVSSTIQVTGNSIQKVSGTSSWYEAGAVSSQMITAGDGYMEFTPGETITWRMCGLGNTDSSAYYGDIEYAFFVAGGGTLQIYESGNLRGSFGTYAASDRLKVAVENGVVKYYRNATLVYTSTVAPMYPLQVDTSLNTVNAGVYNVVISGTRLTASPINYVLQDVQGSTRAVMSGNWIVARHDFLPFGEEIGAGVGMRTSGQGFGVSDKIRQRYAMTERDDATRLDHTWWRKYESFSGRWTSPDPYRGSMSIADPQSFNRFSYVQNDPVNFVDPTGLYWAIDWGSCRTNWVWVAHVEGGGDWYDRGEICNLVWNDWPIMAEPPEPPVGGGPPAPPLPNMGSHPK
jgi:RHS repeat-associated protein